MSEKMVKEKKKRKINDNGRLGMTKLNNLGKQMTITTYGSSQHVSIKFEGENNLIETTYDNFKKGLVKSYNDSLTYGHGIIDSEYIRDENNKCLKSYTTWHNMMERCFSEKLKLKYPTYKDVTCCENWLYYSNFKKFYNENYYVVNGQRTELDKDILHKNNKIYSPENCVFVPQRINIMFIKHSSKRGLYPVGVSYDKRRKKYTSSCLCGYDKFFGSFTTPELAFNAYKRYKEKCIKEIAEEYKSQIPQILYDAMYRYRVEITD